MNKFPAAAGLALALISGSAFAADLPSRKAPPVAPPSAYNWGGLYGGINVGYGFGANNANWGSISAPQVNVAQWGSGVAAIPAGVLGGGQLGYNYQWNPYLVIGAEADIQASDVNGSGYWATGANTGNAIVGGRSYLGYDWFGTARGRVGLTMPSYSNFLVYGTGGFAYGYVNNTVSNQYFVNTPIGNGASGVSTYGNTQVGWAAGGGVEWSPQTFPAWSAKVEYLYTNLGSVQQGVYSTYTSGGPQYGFGASRTSQMQFNTVRAGLNWHFNPFVGEPIVAKY
jgi:outer membrane immunogenic protein